MARIRSLQINYPIESIEATGKLRTTFTGEELNTISRLYNRWVNPRTAAGRAEVASSIRECVRNAESIKGSSFNSDLDTLDERLAAVTLEEWNAFAGIAGFLQAAAAVSKFLRPEDWPHAADLITDLD